MAQLVAQLLPHCESLFESCHEQFSNIFAAVLSYLTRVTQTLLSLLYNNWSSIKISSFKIIKKPGTVAGAYNPATGRLVHEAFGKLCLLGNYRSVKFRGRYNSICV